MQLKSFILPVFDAEKHEDELNRFLRGHRILQVSRNFCTENGGYWAVLVEYMDGEASGEVEPAFRNEKKKDMTEGMTQTEKDNYKYLATIRRELALKMTLPAYMIFTNAELAILARQPELTPDMVKGIKGIAPKRLNQYLSYFLPQPIDETSGIPDGEDSPS